MDGSAASAISARLAKQAVADAFGQGVDDIGELWHGLAPPYLPLFDWLEDAADGEMWSDVEQGWEMIAIRSGSSFHFRQGGFDQGGEYANVAFPRDDLLASVARLRERMNVIIARLTAEIGEDYWTRQRYDLRTDLT